MWPLTPKEKRYWVRITYRSGVQFDLSCTKYEVVFDESLGECLELNMQGLKSDHANPKFTNLKAIESVWQLP